MRGATLTNLDAQFDSDILQSTPHMRGATSDGYESCCSQLTSIHAPHAWGDGDAEDVLEAGAKLQSTPHMRGATIPFFSHLISANKLQSTPHMRGATHGPSGCH